MFSFFSSLSFLCFVLLSVYLTFYNEMDFSAGQVFPSFLSLFYFLFFFLGCVVAVVVVVGGQGAAVGDTIIANY